MRACSASNSNTVSIVGSGTPIVAKHRFAIFAMVSLSIDPDVAASAQQAQMLHGKPRRCDDGWPARPRFDRSTLRAGKNDAMLAGQLAQALSDSRVSGCYTRARVWNFPSGTAAQRGSPVATNGGGEGAAAQTCAKTDQPVICAHTKHVGVTHHGVQQTAMIPDDAGVPVEPDVYPIAA